MPSPEDFNLATRMAELARLVAAPRTLNDIMADVCDTARELIPGADVASVLLIGQHRAFQTLPPKSDDLAHQLHRLQIEYDEGPCVKAALEQVIVRTDDFRDESRWPMYAPACVDIGILGGLSFKLYTADKTAGALDLFSTRPNVWSGEAETIGAVLAAHAAAAILASRQGEQLQAALSTRDRIGQAKGIIMERYNVDDVRAFEMLKQLSQEGNIKLVDIANDVIGTRTP